ncbi:phage terminase large subunit family protein [Pseudomonas aeruginosa]|uniref:phage terminase large subunit family protein n=1 Tax=Pseudomonas aeruginosa TaxID=287 RepID=UPI002A6AF6A8|nr:terminase gpA endonuclease subunit [Pseudomonas aeruginosa]MDY1511914.1 terminase gpA endonuclease subunit [Pseudomonas aeruginosa]
MTSLSTVQIEACQAAMSAGLLSLRRDAPQTPVAWADDNFYLSSESSYQEGRWETLPYQVAMLNAMGNDEIRIVNVIKSARVGYSKMLLAASAYQIEHKRRHIAFFVPDDGSADLFMKSEIETMIRDVGAVRALAPWCGKKSRDNTLDIKKFSHGKQLWCRGGKAAKNYRAISADTVIYDELAAFDHDIDKEGSPLVLGDKRIEGSTFPKSIRGSTPKLRGPIDRGGCQIEGAVQKSPHLLRYHIPCPHCGAEQYLKWGGKDCVYGIKWDPEQPEDAWYVCEATGCLIRYSEALEAQYKARWICEKTGIWTRDGFDFFDAEGAPIPTPESISFHIWTAYSFFVTWGRIAQDFLQAKGSRSDLKTFVNTTLGETWEEDQGERVEWDVLLGRREVWQGEIPAQAVILTGGGDTQDDRYEGRVWAWGPNEECWLVYRFVLMGDPGGEELRRKRDLELHRQFTRSDGLVMKVERWCWDAGGHYIDQVCDDSKKNGLLWMIPIIGAPVYGKPIASFPTKRNKRGVYLTTVGTDNAKELFYSRLRLPLDVSKSQAGITQPQVIHLPANDLVCDEMEVRQLTSESKVLKVVKGVQQYRWDNQGRRNEALDCFVYALAALRISQQRFGLDLERLAAAGVEALSPTTDERPRVQSSYWKKA